MNTDDRESESESESAEHRFSGRRKVLLWLVGATLLAVVGYHGALGARVASSAARAPITAADEHASPPGGHRDTATLAGATTAGGERADPAPTDTAAARCGVDRAGENTHCPPEAAAPGASGGGLAAAPVGRAAPAQGDGAGAAKGEAANKGAASGGAANGGAAGEAAQAITSDGRIILNLATEAELRKLPGIGKSRARAIVEQRERVGRFRRLEDLLRVKGIGPRRLAALRAKVVLDLPR